MEETKIDIKEENEEWAICCSRSSAHFIKYMVQVIVCLCILIFAIINISLGRTDSVYWSMITLIIGVFVPSPSLSKGSK